MAQQRREAWRAQADAQAELDWERYGKYDMLHELLQAATSEPSLQVCACTVNNQSLAGTHPLLGLPHMACPCAQPCPR